MTPLGAAPSFKLVVNALGTHRQRWSTFVLRKAPGKSRGSPRNYTQGQSRGEEDERH